MSRSLCSFIQVSFLLSQFVSSFVISIAIIHSINNNNNDDDDDDENNDNKQLLDEVEHDIVNYQNLVSVLSDKNRIQ